MTSFSLTNKRHFNLHPQAALIFKSAKKSFPELKNEITLEICLRYKSGNGSNTLLHFELKNQVINYDLIRALIEHKSDLESLNDSKLNPLHIATKSKSSIAIINLMIEKKSPISNCDKFGNIPLHYATKNENLEVIKLVVEKSSSLNLQNNLKSTPFFSICSPIISLKLIQFCFENGGDVNWIDVRGRNALHHVFQNNHSNQEILEYLIEQKCDQNFLDRSIQSAPCCMSK